MKLKKIIKCLCVGLAMVVLVTTLTSNLNAIYANEVSNVNGTIIDGTSYVELRSLCTALGLDVVYNSETQQITCQSNDTLLELQLNNKNATLNGEKITLDVGPTLVNGLTMLPVRTIAETLGQTVVYDASTDMITIAPAQIKIDIISDVTTNTTDNTITNITTDTNITTNNSDLHVAITATGSKYHKGTSCRTVSDVSEWLTIEEALSLGYTSCGICY